MTKVVSFSITGKMMIGWLGLAFLCASVIADFDPYRAVAGCALLCTTKYLNYTPKAP